MLRYAIRKLIQSPGFALTTVVVLALGIGANSAVFSVVDAVMLRPLPYFEPQRLVQVYSYDEKRTLTNSLSYPNFFDLRQRSHSFSHLVSFTSEEYTLTGAQRPEHLLGMSVSWDLLPMLGVRPELGRGFVADEEKVGTRVVLISHALWVSQFNTDKSIIGHYIDLSGRQFRVIGVMPSSFRFPVNSPRTAFWTSLAVDESFLAKRGSRGIDAIGRLLDGVSIAQANQDIKFNAAQLAQAYPDTNTRYSSAIVKSELEAVLGDRRELLLVVLASVVLVLLVACGNIANLQLARVRDRQREIAVRVALGAGRGEIVLQLFSESLVLAVLGAAVGCALAYIATPAVLNLLGDSVPRARDAGIDLRVLGFALFASLLSALIFGLLPAVTASRPDLARILQQGSRGNLVGRDLLRKTVIVLQVAFGILLTTSAALLISSYLTLTHTDKGFNPTNVLTFTFETPDLAYAHSRPTFYRRYFERLRALPGVRSAGGTMLLPMTEDMFSLEFDSRGRLPVEGTRPVTEATAISPAFFRTMQIPFLEGRDFSETDTIDSPQAIIVNRDFAERFFPGQDAVGKEITPRTSRPVSRQIVGVVGNVRHSVTQRDMQPVMYLPASQLPTWCCLYTVVRTSINPVSLEPTMRQLVASMDPNIPVTEVRTMQELLSFQLAAPRFAMTLLSSFAGLALVLTVLGLYGVMSYSVARRTREIGLRMALGAHRAVVLRMILRDAAVLIGSGIAIGAGAVLTAGPLIARMLYGVGPRDPFVLGWISLGMASTGLLAAYIPAVRAAAIEPMQALRTD
ncbi:MAG: ABC transporter permease [Bryobacteraceae bacterium]|jgi:putative ABC transport system permease protein